LLSLVSAEDFVYNTIKQRIMNGQLLPGTRLVHRKLAKELGLSSAPVVLALRLLERDHLVVNMPGMGAYVRSWEKDEIRDLYRVRAVLEGLASRMCAERATTVDLNAIVAANESYKAAFARKDAAGIIKGSFDFHSAVIHGATAPELADTIGTFSTIDASMRSFCLVLGVPMIMTAEGERDHDKILEAILNKDGDAAEQSAREHVERTLPTILEWFDQMNSRLGDKFNSGVLAEETTS